MKHSGHYGCRVCPSEDLVWAQLPCLLTETLKCFNRSGPFLNEVKYVWKRYSVDVESS